MASGIYTATKKDGTIYYRASIHYHTKHIALGSFENTMAASAAYQAAHRLLDDHTAMLPDVFFQECYASLSYEKLVILLNFRDNGMYLGTPIYLKKGYFVYYLSPEIELKFDNDDLFFYSGHRILRRGGHLYTNDYGMQISLLSRYGIKSHAVPGVDYEFVNGDFSDLRYANIRNINPYYGVSRIDNGGRISYLTKIHINGYYQIGIYDSDTEAAIAYNLAVDLAKAAGIKKNYPTNYIAGLSASAYADFYTRIKVSRAYREYLARL